MTSPPNPANCDAFAPGKDILTTDEAITALIAATNPVAETETIALLAGYGRVLAHDLVAKRTVPAADNSAMDGYGVRTADLDAKGGDVRLPLKGRVAAGYTLGRAIAPGEAVRIFTGAPVPEGVDAVIPQENTRHDNGPEGDGVWVPLVPAGSNIRPAGEDFKTGDVVLPAGKHLLPQDIGHAAAAGYPALEVRRRPNVMLFATGDEVCEPGTELGPEKTVNSNLYTLFGLVQRLGCQPHYLGILPDRPDALKAALAKAAADGADAIMTSGGVSIGEEDHVKSVVESLGALHFWRIAIRPGRPLAFGRIGPIPFVGLPGNPVAATVTFMLFARPLLLTLAGALYSPPQRIPVIADFSYKKKPGRREWLRGSLGTNAIGQLTASHFPQEGSGIFSSVVASTGLIELTEDSGNIKPGDPVTYIAFNEMLG